LAGFLTAAITVPPHHSRLHRRRILPTEFQAVLPGSHSFLRSVSVFYSMGRDCYRLMTENRSKQRVISFTANRWCHVDLIKDKIVGKKPLVRSDVRAE
jgi:hypothetical protein